MIALIVARWTLGITFGQVAKITSEGVEFAKESTAKLGDLEGKLNGLALEVKALKNTSPIQENSALQAKVFEETQTVSDQTAQLAKAPLGTSAKAKQTGVIWIGNYSNTWDRAMLSSPDTGQPITLAPDKIESGTEYVVLGNMVLRDGLPERDQDYFRSRKSLGIVSKGTRVRVVRKPVPFDRGFAIQYWAEVETL